MTTNNNISQDISTKYSNSTIDNLSIGNYNYSKNQKSEFYYRKNYIKWDNIERANKHKTVLIKQSI